MADKRPDIEAAPYKRPNHLAPIIFPMLYRPMTAGTLYFADLIADADAQTSRTVGAEPTGTLIAEANTTYTMVEAIKRRKIGQSKIAEFGGLDKAQMVMGKAAKRSVADMIESKAIAATFGDAGNMAGAADILTSFLKALDTAVETIQDNGEGRIALFGASKVINRLKRYSEITGRMIYTGVVPRDAKDVRSIHNDVLAGALGIDVVLAGPSTAAADGWLGATSAYDGWLGVVILPDPDVDPIEEVQFGRTIAKTMGANGELMEVETFKSDTLKAEVLDATAWYNVKALNKELCYVLKGIDEANAVTTTA